MRGVGVNAGDVGKNPGVYSRKGTHTRTPAGVPATPTPSTP